MACGELDEERRKEEQWVKVIKGSKITKTSSPYYTPISNAYAQLEELTANTGPPPETQTKN